MKLEIHNHLGRPQVIEATRVVVLDKYDNPVSVSLEVSDGLIVTTHIEDPGFHNLIRDLGITKTVVVVQPRMKPLQEIVFPQD